MPPRLLSRRQSEVSPQIRTLALRSGNQVRSGVVEWGISIGEKAGER